MSFSRKLILQAIVISAAIAFILLILKPHWFTHFQGNPVLISESAHDNKIDANPVLSYRAAAKLAMPSVVNIFSSKKNSGADLDFLSRRFFDQEESPNLSSLGSGVIVSSSGIVITNHHVIEQATSIDVALSDGRKVEAKLIGSDPETDLAVLQLPLDKLPAITFAPATQLEIGDVVFAIGNPFGVGQTMTMGIVSALRRDHLGINTFENFIQTDAAINPGNSGGALVDSAGHLVGINAAIYSQSGGSEGIGFAIPNSIVKEILASIVRDGQVVRGWIGVAPQDLNEALISSFDLKVSHGVIITAVVRDGPAARAGLRPGDVVIKIANDPIKDSVDLLTAIAKQTPNTRIAIEFIRKNKNQTVQVQVGKRQPMKKK